MSRPCLDGGHVRPSLPKKGQQQRWLENHNLGDAVCTSPRKWPSFDGVPTWLLGPCDFQFHYLFDQQGSLLLKPSVGPWKIFKEEVEVVLVVVFVGLPGCFSCTSSYKMALAKKSAIHGAYDLSALLMIYLILIMIYPRPWLCRKKHFGKSF